MKINDNYRKNFWTTKGVRQGCPLSPLLFNVMIEDIKEKLGRNRVGGEVGIESEK